MAEVVDIEVKDDIEIFNGDLKLAESDQQHVEHILRARPGQFYQFPTLGVGVDDKKLASINAQVFKQQIKQNLQADNFRVNKIDILGDIDNFTIDIAAERLK